MRFQIAFRPPHKLAALLIMAMFLFAAPVFAADGDFERGLKLYQSGAFEKAAGAFKGAVAGDPDSANSYFYLGLSLYKLDRFAAAGAAFDRVIALDPAYGAALLFRGMSHQADGA